MPTSNTALVIVIGCGPAGAGASFFLSNAGIPHIILEKEKFPRDKICGDGCSGKTAFVLRKANPKWLDEIFEDEEKFLPSFGVTFAAPNGKAVDIPFTLDKQTLNRPPGFTSKRLHLDNFLLQKTKTHYATVIEGAQVLQLERNESGYSVTYKTEANEQTQTINCQLLIGADGDKGIARKVLLQDNAVVKTSAIGLRGYYEGVTGLHHENYIELRFLKEVLPGYFWIFPLPGGAANVGLGIQSDVVRKKKLNLRALMQDAIENNPTIKMRFANAKLSGKLYGWGLPMSAGATKISGDNFMLVGDAASLIDPFTGEGIGNGLFSGMLAAEAAIKALEENNFSGSFLQMHYADILFKRIGSELKLSYKMLQLIRYPWLFNLVVNKANKSPSLRNTITSMFADLDMRALLRKPSFYWNILMNK